MSALAQLPGAARRARFEVTEVPLFAPWVSAAHEGLCVAQLSDLHIGPGTPGSRVKAAVQPINELRPDLAVITGDFVTLSRRPVRRIGSLLLYVNRGLCFGPGSPLFRVRCPPELSVFTLTRKGSVHQIAPSMAGMGG
jgi:predicted MPP superfamily phosphohydrolase